MTTHALQHWGAPLTKTQFTGRLPPEFYGNQPMDLLDCQQWIHLWDFGKFDEFKYEFQKYELIILLNIVDLCPGHRQKMLIDLISPQRRRRIHRLYMRLRI